MEREELVDSFAKLEADIITLKKMLDLRYNLLQAYDNNSKDEMKRIVDELDELDGSLKCVELWS